MKVVKQEDGEDEEDCYAGIADLFDGVVYSKLSAFQRRVNRVLKVGRLAASTVHIEPKTGGRESKIVKLKSVK